MSFFGPAAVLAQRQHSTITTAQLRHHGYSAKHIRRLVAEGVLRRVAPGVFVIAGSQPTWHQQLAVALHRGGPTSLVGHRSAAGLWHLDRFRSGLVEVVGPWHAARTGTGTDVAYYRTSDLPSRDRAVRDGLAVTTPTRSLIDMARHVGAARRLRRDDLPARPCVAPGESVAVECDGFRFHRTPEDLGWDARRNSELALRGWVVQHVTWRMLREDPDDLTARCARR